MDSAAMRPQTSAVRTDATRRVDKCCIFWSKSTDYYADLNIVPLDPTESKATRNKLSRKNFCSIHFMTMDTTILILIPP